MCPETRFQFQIPVAGRDIIALAKSASSLSKQELPIQRVVRLPYIGSFHRQNPPAFLASSILSSIFSAVSGCGQRVGDASICSKVGISFNAGLEIS